MKMEFHVGQNRISHAALAQIVIDIIFLVLILSLLVGVMHKSRSSEEADFYAEAATVTTINEMKGFTGFTDESGREMYTYQLGEWSVGDIVLLLIDGKGTAYLYDDEITNVSLLMYAPVV